MSKQVKGKIKSMFAKNKASSGTAFDKGTNRGVISKEILKEIDHTQALMHRVRNLKELSEIVTAKVMEEHDIEALLHTTSDLIDQSVPMEGRHAALQFVIAITNGQYERLGILRSHLFNVVVTHDVTDDLHYRITLLKVLTDDGKNISYCEQIGPFLDRLMASALGTPNSVAFLSYLVKIVHYNSSFLDKNIICSIVRQTCEFCNNVTGEQDIESSLQLLDATVRYGGLPADGLLPLIETLCRTVNIEKFCQSSWKLMRNLIGTRLGHTAIFIMCQILEENNHILDVILLRGAVFFIGMAIWGSKRVSTLRFSPLHVLSSFKVSLQCRHNLVAHEVVLSLQRLVRKFGEDQEIITWDIIMDIIESLLQMINRGNKEDWNMLYKQIHILLTSIEALYLEERFYGSSGRFFRILANCAKDRPEDSIATLLRYYEDKIDPNNSDWKEIYDMLIENYLKKEKRSGVRVKLLETILNLYSRYRHRHEDKLIPFILQGHVAEVAFEYDKDVRRSLANLLSFILQHCSSDKYPDVLKLVDDFLSYISKQTAHSGSLEGLGIVVDSLIRTFHTRLFEPCNAHVVGMLKILIKHVNDHYNFNVASITGGQIRQKIFKLLLALRSSDEHFIGIMDQQNRKTKYSSHAIFKPHDVEAVSLGANAAARTWLVNCDFQLGFDALLKCLKNELDWDVLAYVLANIAAQMENKNLYVFCQCNINKLCSTLCTVINDKTFLNKMKNCPTTISMSELRNLVFPVLSTLSTYSKYLSRDRQHELVTSIEFGFQTRSAETCVSCLTICILEMQSIMRRVLPSILVKLSQISATVTMSTPILKFLSTLKEIPVLYSNFVEEQYMSIFAMALPYTLSSKYSPYIVTSAYQVIADWFTRCRLAFRKGFVSLIVKALKANSGVVANTGSKEKDKALDDDMKDVCLDMMARYSFSLHIGQPKRSALVDFLLSQGNSQTWLIGNMIVTVTTSPSDTHNCECFRKREPSDSHNEEEISSMSTFQMVDSIEVIRDGNDDVDDDGDGDDGSVETPTFEDPPSPAQPPAQTDEYGAEVVEEEEFFGEKPLVRLTRKLVEQDPMFSPSEKLLFSRQTSKVVNDGMMEVDSSDSDEYLDSVSVNNDQDQVIVKDPYPFHEGPVFEMESSGEFESNKPSGKVPDKDVIPPRQQAQPRHSEVFKDPPTAAHQCRCQCSGWAEIVIQRPTGKISWLIKSESQEKIPAVDFSDLDLLSRNIDGTDCTASISGSLKSADSDFGTKHSNCSDTSSIASSTRRRRFSTGSIDNTTLQQLDGVGGVLMLNHGQQQNKPIEKRAVAKTLSQPNYAPSFHRRRSSSVINSTFKTPAPNAHANDLQNKPINDNFWSPNFVFLQMFYSSFGNVFQSTPILLEETEATQRTLKILDRIPAFNTHKFGVLYIGKDQHDEVEILQNEFGGVRYTEFLSGLGELISLGSHVATDYFTGGLSGGEDGKFACIWKDSTTQVVFHVATLMPIKECDAKCISKKRHIGNNFVTIIYDDSETGYAFGTIKGQFNLAEIIIRPIEYASNVVTARIKRNDRIVYLTSQTISDENLPILVRQLAVHTNMSLVIGEHDDTTNAYAFSWLQRLRQIKRIRSKVVSSDDDLTEPYDFTNYT